MIDLALKFLGDEANGFMSRRLGLELGKLDMGPLVDLNTGLLAVAQDTTRLSLYLIEEERALREQMPLRQIVAGREVTLPPPLKINLVVAVTGRFQNYDEGLRRLACLLTNSPTIPVYNAQRLVMLNQAGVVPA